MSIYKKWESTSSFIESYHNTWHKITDDNQIAHSNSKTLDSDRSVKHNRSIRIGDLGERKEGSNR